MEWKETDENLMLRYQGGEEEAFSELYRRYQRRLYGYLCQKGMSNVVVEEVFQNIWTKLHQSRFRYDSKFKFSAWLFTIARSVIVDTFRKERKFQSLDSIEEMQISSHNQGQETLVQNSELPWEEISIEDKQALEWRYLEDISFEEIGQRLGVNPVSVRQRISRALKKLKQGFLKRNL